MGNAGQIESVTMAFSRVAIQAVSHRGISVLSIVGKVHKLGGYPAKTLEPLRVSFF